ncbi:MAG: tRNA lysidine(34) synthetase TilS [Candidatus Omnitrophota bacterium]
MTTIQIVRAYIKKHKLLNPGDKVIIGVSGGPDSIALLSILDRLKHELGIQIHVAHYNHQLRPSARRDQTFVENLCTSMNLGCSVGKSLTLKNKKTGSIEEAARLERIDFFLQVKKKTKFHLVALAHTQDELAETILMRIIRGSGLQGLRAIQPVSHINELKIIHPFLERSKKEILKYLEQSKIAFKTDPTNRQLKFFRNKIRLNLLPLLEKEYNPNIKETLVNLTSTLSVDFDFISAKTEELFQKICVVDLKRHTVKVPSAKIIRQPASLQRMLFRQIYRTLKGDTNRLEQKHILAIEELLSSMPDGSRVHWPCEMTVQKNKGILFFRISE